MYSDLSSLALFADFNDIQIQKLSKIVNVKKYLENEYIFVEGDKSDAFYIILKGRVKVVKSSIDGKEKILEVMNKGDFLGEMGVIDNKPRSASGVALGDVKLISVEREDFLKLITENPEIALKIIMELGNRLRKANRDIELLAFFDVETRMRELFKRLAVPGNNSEDMVVEKLTHHEIADHIGTSRETVTRLINKMMEKNYLEIKNNKFILKNVKKW